MKYALADIFEKPISGEWGIDLDEGEIGVKVIRTTNFTNLGRLNLSDVVVRNIDREKYKDKVLRYGDIIIEKSGGSPTQPVGRVVVFEEKTDEKYYCNNFTSILRPKELVNYKYSLYLLKDLYNKRKVLKYQNKTTGIINIKLNDYLQGTEVIIPSLEAQKKIAEALDKAQSLIDKRKTQIEALDELIKSVFYDMFGDLKLNKRNFDSMKLSKICTKITDGTHNSPENTKAGIPYVTAKHLGIDGIDFYSKPTYISLQDHQTIFKRCNPIKGDVLYIKDGATTGVAAINKFDFEFSMLSSLALFKLDKKLINNYFLLNYLNNDTIKANILNDMVGGAIKRLTLVRIKNIEVVVPPIDLQNKFAETVENIETQKQLLQQSLTQLETNFNSLMQKAFKGELFN